MDIAWTHTFQMIQYQYLHINLPYYLTEVEPNKTVLTRKPTTGNDLLCFNHSSYQFLFHSCDSKHEYYISYICVLLISSQ